MNNEAAPADDVLRKMMAKVPRNHAARFIELAALTDGFCEAHLNAEYKELCRKMVAAICRKKNSPLLGGKSEGWAAGVVYSVGRVNFLTDPGQTPHMTAAEIAADFGIAVSTMHAKAGVIRDALDLIPFDPDWCLPGKLKDNPLVWMLEVNGFLMDIRLAPREAQVVAYEKGLIPYIPADRPDTLKDSDQ